MDLKLLITLQLERVFGWRFKTQLVQCVQADAEKGHWEEDCWMAYEPLLSDEEAQLLFEALFSSRKELLLDPKMLEAWAWNRDYCRPQWQVQDDLSYLLCDDISIAKFAGNELCWTSERLSLDGIKLIRADLYLIEGYGWWGGEPYVPNSYFKLSCVDGTLLEGF